MISLSSSSSPPLLLPLPSLSLPSPFVPPFFFLLPTLSIPFLPPLYLYALFNFSFFFVTSLPPFTILGLLCPSTHFFPVFNQYSYQTFFFFTSFLFLLPLLLSQLVIVQTYLWRSERIQRCLNSFTRQNVLILHFLRAPGWFRVQSSATLPPLLCVYWLNIH